VFLSTLHTLCNQVLSSTVFPSITAFLPMFLLLSSSIYCDFMAMCIQVFTLLTSQLFPLLLTYFNYQINLAH
jgi:hypothetical protein